MSFNSTFDNDIERIATNHSHKYKDYPEFESLSTSIDNQLHHISQTQLSTIKQDLLQFEKDPLDSSIAEKLSSEFKQTTESYRKLNDFVKQLNNTIKSVEDEREDVEIINYLKQKESIQIKLIRDSLGNFKIINEGLNLNNLVNYLHLDLVTTPQTHNMAKSNIHNSSHNNRYKSRMSQ